MTGVITVHVRGILIGRRAYKSGMNSVSAIIREFTRNVNSHHAVITVIPDVTPELERKHCERLQALSLLRE